MVEDHPGVLAQVTSVLGEHNISIASVLQHEAARSADGIVPLVIMTHETTEGATRKACAEINKLTCVRGQDGADVGEGLGQLRIVGLSDCGLIVPNPQSD